MIRRDFLRAAGLAPILAGLGSGFALATAPAGRKLLVLVELKGGNDGLNTVVPCADPAYRKLRPRLAIDREQVLVLDDETGLHPSLGALLPAWKAGQLAIVQGLGYPDPNLSHFRSIEIWDTASRSEEYLDEGWLARVFSKSPSPPEFAADGVVVGASDMGPLAGGKRCIALTSPEQFLRNARLARAEGDSRNQALAHILRVEREIVNSAQKLHAGKAFRTEFPQGSFGSAMKTTAQLAANSAGIGAIRVTIGGFDTHANQAGVHANLLRQLAEGLMALRSGLVEIGRWETTVIATYSEFGRRPYENQSGGTDHGTAGVHFVLGGAVRGGSFGDPPSLDRLDSAGNMAFQVDFRRYYATLLERWWQIDAQPALGKGFRPLEFLA